MYVLLFIMFWYLWWLKAYDHCVKVTITHQQFVEYFFVWKTAIVLYYFTIYGKTFFTDPEFRISAVFPRKGPQAGGKYIVFIRYFTHFHTCIYCSSIIPCILCYLCKSVQFSLRHPSDNNRKFSWPAWLLTSPYWNYNMSTSYIVSIIPIDIVKYKNVHL